MVYSYRQSKGSVIPLTRLTSSNCAAADPTCDPSPPHSAQLHCAAHTAHCILHTAHCTLHTAHCTLHTANCTLHTAHCTLHTAHCTLHTAHCTLHTAHCSLLTIHLLQMCTACAKSLPKCSFIQTDPMKIHHQNHKYSTRFGNRAALVEL